MAILQVGADGKAPSTAKIGDTIVTAGGSYQITGGTTGSWTSVKLPTTTTSSPTTTTTTAPKPTTTSTSSGTVTVGSSGNAGSGLPIGTVVNTAGGDYKIVAPNTAGATYNPASGYWSVKVGTTSAASTPAPTGTVSVGSDGNAPANLPIGTKVSTAGGIYTIVAPNTPGATLNPTSGYWSIKDTTAPSTTTPTAPGTPVVPSGESAPGPIPSATPTATAPAPTFNPVTANTTPMPTPTKAGTTPMPTPVTASTTDLTALIKSLYDGQETGVMEAYNNINTELQRQLAQNILLAQQTADKARSSEYVGNRLSAIGNNEGLANQGLAGNLYGSPTSGISESSRIKQDVAMGNNLNNITMNQQNTEAQLRGQQATTVANNQLDLAKLIAQFNQTEASALINQANTSNEWAREDANTANNWALNGWEITNDWAREDANTANNWALSEWETTNDWAREDANTANEWQREDIATSKAETETAKQTAIANFISTIGAYYQDYQAEINRINAMIAKGDTTDAWKIPYLTQARNEKLEALRQQELEAQQQAFENNYNLQALNK